VSVEIAGPSPLIVQNPDHVPIFTTTTDPG
jgi:hypothetical protein